VMAYPDARSAGDDSSTTLRIPFLHHAKFPDHISVRCDWHLERSNRQGARFPVLRMTLADDQRHGACRAYCTCIVPETRRGRRGRRPRRWCARPRRRSRLVACCLLCRSSIQTEEEQCTGYAIAI
jgi:hypothetical protein